MLRRVFITGANSGIGFELAKQYISRGDDVALFDLHFNEQTKQSLSDLADDYQYIEYFATPICDNEALQTQVNNAIAAIGKPDLAIFSCSTNEQLSKENSIDSIACQHFATLITPHLSMNGHLAITSPLIDATKFTPEPNALILAKKLRKKFKPNNIKISLICASKTSKAVTNPANTAQHILRSLDKQKLMVILGLQSKLTYIMSRYLPNWIMGSVMDRLIKQQLIRTTR
ncbi:MAG: SDR family NAD(P)-dependent oxidoreductase [Pseudoalteromonas sp.]|uniref:SDR family NAD(P)-dependent oxidoreductase n=1 Tax=Pseudoalteromonas TaxID=53246 RepID=UPI001D9A2609|nr:MULTISPECIES: SDR family NAD(P)-dependent oxidoreductase [Pseudoalteromonas]MCG9734981.1 SDR family NAD(P)-dependent oxidoreductase [Pseudoalteromonas shioyasakiensis]NRA77517.1 SDR family NAD(P)-dependent oxidoreductase [Pseudoalteromonas sp.]